MATRIRWRWVAVVMFVLASATLTVDAVRDKRVHYDHDIDLQRAYEKYRSNLEAQREKAKSGTRQEPVNTDPLVQKYKYRWHKPEVLPQHMCGKDLRYRPLKIKPVFDLFYDESISNRIGDEDLGRTKEYILEVLAELEGLIHVPFQHPQKILDQTMTTIVENCGFKNFVSDIPYNNAGENGTNLVVVFSFLHGDSKLRQPVSNDRLHRSMCFQGQEASSVLTDFYAAIFHGRSCDPYGNDREMVVRPVAGRITLCKAAIGESDRARFKLVFKHEMLHILGFTGTTCKLDRDQKLYRPLAIPFQTVKMADLKIPADTTPFTETNRQFLAFHGVRSVAAAQRHFNCSSIVGVPFEDDEGGEDPARDTTGTPLEQHERFCHTSANHWERYYFGTELMIAKVNEYGHHPMSEITAAFFEDAMMYRINRTPAFRKQTDSYWYGKDYGCAFIRQGCAQWAQHVKQTVTKFSDQILCAFPILPSVTNFISADRALQLGVLDMPLTIKNTILSQTVVGGVQNIESTLQMSNLCFNDSTKPEACFTVESDIDYSLFDLDRYLDPELVPDTDFVLVEDNVTQIRQAVLSRGADMLVERCPMWDSRIDSERVTEHFGRRPHVCQRSGGEGPFQGAAALRSGPDNVLRGTVHASTGHGKPQQSICGCVGLWGL